MQNWRDGRYLMLRLALFARVGQRILAGDLPYVDIWDRKPPRLFFAYPIIALGSSSPLAYRLTGPAVLSPLRDSAAGSAMRCSGSCLRPAAGRDCRRRRGCSLYVPVPMAVRLRLSRQGRRGCPFVRRQDRDQRSKHHAALGRSTRTLFRQRTSPPVPARFSIPLEPPDRGRCMGRIDRARAGQGSGNRTRYRGRQHPAPQPAGQRCNLAADHRLRKGMQVDRAP